MPIIDENIQSKFDDLDAILQKHIDISAELQRNTVTLSSMVAELKMLLVTTDSSLKNTERHLEEVTNAINNSSYDDIDFEGLKESIDNLLRIMSFSSPQKRKRIAKQFGDISNVTIDTEDDESEDIDFDGLADEATTMYNEQSIANTVNTVEYDDVKVSDIEDTGIFNRFFDDNDNENSQPTGKTVVNKTQEEEIVPVQEKTVEPPKQETPDTQDSNDGGGSLMDILNRARINNF